MAKSSGFASAVDTHDGLGGPFSRTVYRRLATEPSEPTGGDLTVSPNVAPTDWFFEPPVGTIQLWKSVVRYVPGGDVFETTDITYSGITGVQDGTPAVFEDGFFDVNGTPGTDVVAVAEISTVTTTGVSGLQVGTDAVAEDGFFDVNGTPGTDITAVAEISTVTTTGTSGLRVENPLTAEEGFFDVNGTPGTDITAVAEISTVTTTGTSGVVVNQTGTTEIQTITQSGTRSNVTSGSTNRTITLQISGDTFNTGSSQDFLSEPLTTSFTLGSDPTNIDISGGGGLAYPATGTIYLIDTGALSVPVVFQYTSRTDTSFTGQVTRDGTGSVGLVVVGPQMQANNLGTVFHPAAASSSFPTSPAVDTSLTEGWRYQPSSSSTFGNTDYPVMPRVFNTTGAVVGTGGVYYLGATVTIDATVPAIAMTVTVEGYSSINDNTVSVGISAMSDGTPYSQGQFWGSGSLKPEDFIIWRVSNNSGVDITYTVNSIDYMVTNSSSTGTEASEYTLDLDTGGSLTPNGSITAFFGNELNSNTALDSLSGIITGNWVGEVTTGAVTSVTTARTGNTDTRVLDRRDSEGPMRTDAWDITRTFGAYRQAEDGIDYETGVDYGTGDGVVTGWDAWINPNTNVNNWFGTDPRSGTDWINALILAETQPDLTNGTLTLIDTIALAAGEDRQATFGVKRVHNNGDFPNDYWIELDSIISQSTLDPTYVPSETADSTVLRWDATLSFDTIDSSTLDVFTSSTDNVTAAFTITPNLGVAATMITFADAAGMLSGTASTYTVTTNEGVVSTFDSSSDLAAVDLAIMTIINPTDFNYTLSGNDIIITADEDGDKTGTWTISANHHGVPAAELGDIAFGTAVIAPNGVDGIMTGTLDTWTVTVDGTPYTGTFTSGSDANSQATQIVAVLNADT